MPDQCKGITRNGSRCSRSVNEGQEYCHQHRPSLIKWLRRIGVFGFLVTLFIFLSNLEGFLSFMERVIDFLFDPSPTATPAVVTETATSTSSATQVLQFSMTPVEPSQTSTIHISTPSPTNHPYFCNSVKEFCYYLPSESDSWPLVAKNSAFEDSCDWPLIANVNRGTDGKYRIVGNILMRVGIFIPMVTDAEGSWPTIRLSDGKSEQIHECSLNEQGYTLPCVYVITEGDGIVGKNYESLAWDHYFGIEKDNVRLDQLIMDANLSDGCRRTPVLLQPGKLIVIPSL